MSKYGMFCLYIGEGRIKTPMGTPNVQVRYVLPVYWGETNKTPMGAPNVQVWYVLPVYWGETSKGPDRDPKCPNVVCTAGVLGRDE